MVESKSVDPQQNALARRALPLNTGGAIPAVGLGVFRARPEEAYEAIRQAIAAGYRHIDTAQVYGNEKAVGAAIRDSGVPRESIFVTTKLWNDYQGTDRVIPAFERSVEALGLGAPDLFLLHWPVPGKRLDSWAALERLYKEGRVKAIGVSNFMVRHLEELLAHAKVQPAVNQIEISPFLQQTSIRDFCRAHGIVVEAYSPLTKGQRIGHPVIVDVAAKLGVTPAQVLLRWGLQHGLVILPKSTRAERIKQNLDLDGFAMDEAVMARLDALEENLVTGWNPQAVD